MSPADRTTFRQQLQQQGPGVTISIGAQPRARRVGAVISLSGPRRPPTRSSLSLVLDADARPDWPAVRYFEDRGLHHRHWKAARRVPWLQINAENSLAAFAYMDCRPEALRGAGGRLAPSGHVDGRRRPRPPVGGLGAPERRPLEPEVLGVEAAKGPYNLPKPNPPSRPGGARCGVRVGAGGRGADRI